MNLAEHKRQVQRKLKTRCTGVRVHQNTSYTSAKP